MNEEVKLFRFSAINNFIIGVIKLFSGIVFNVNALVADSIYTFCDLVTDVIGIGGAKLSRKRPNKYHPYGFGRIEYIANLFIGVLFILVGTFLLTQGFILSKIIPDIVVLVFIGIGIFMKYIAMRKFERELHRTKNPKLIDSINEAKLDIYSSYMVVIVIILLQFSDTYPILHYSDIIASVIYVLLIFRMAILLLRNNVLHLLGEVETDIEILESVKEEVSKIHAVTLRRFELVKYGNYYRAHLVLLMDPNMTLLCARSLEDDVIRHLKSLKDINIRIVNIDFDVGM